MADSEPWVAAVRARLFAARDPGGGVAYRPGGEPCAEPTALAALAFLVAGEEDPVAQAGARACAAALRRWQRSDGAVVLGADASHAVWPTPLALLVWMALGGHDGAAARALASLVAQRGYQYPRDPQGIIDHDTMLAGWSWTEGAHGWIEPTALAVLALARAGQPGHARAEEGRRLLLDRALPSGGWNYGNRLVFGAEVGAQPSATGLALLALSTGPAAGAPLAAACARLEAVLPSLRTPQSLGWGLLGLARHGRLPAAADDWLAESWSRYADGPLTRAELALLLLAARPARALSLLGAGSGGPG